MSSGTAQMALRAQLRAGEDGVTLIEVMVAMVILVVGALGVLTTLDTGNKVTSANLTRDSALGLAREQIEQAREISYATLAKPDLVASALVGSSTVLGTLIGAVPNSVTAVATPVTGSVPAVAANFETKRRGVTYTSTFSSCVLDDPADGIGTTTATPCTPQPASGGGSGSSSSGTGANTPNLNILGIQITGAGTLTEAICSLIGRNNATLNSLIGTGGLLSALVSTGAAVGLCSSGGAQVAIDRTPADATVVTTVVRWSKPSAGQVSLRTVITGPRVTS